MDDYTHFIFVGEQSTYRLLDSIWYDTASPAQTCIEMLREVRTQVPNVRIVSAGVEHPIDTDERFLLWVKHVFSPTGSSYECDFSAYL